MKKFYYLFFYAFLLGTVSLGVTSCGDDDEPTPEIVENPLEETVYYIVGKVTENSAALVGVTVSTSGQEATTADDGTFELKVSAKGDYTLAFAKTGYVAVSGVATIASSAGNNSSVSITQQLVKKNDPVTVTEEGTIITEAKNENLTLEVPAGAVQSPTEITITEFTEGVKKEAAGTVRVGLATLSCEPDGITFEKPVTVFLKTGAGNKARFANPRHYIEKSGVWTDSGAAGYDEERQAYTLTLTGFSNHSVSFLATIEDAGTSSEALGTVEIDNLGNMTAITGEVNTTQKIGWEVNGNVTNLVKAALPGLSDMEVSGMVTSINTSLQSLKGSTPGVSEKALALGTAQVSGDMKVVYTFTSSVRNENFVFTVIYDGTEEHISIPVKTYRGTLTSTAYTYGETHTEHSGGGGQ